MACCAAMPDHLWPGSPRCCDPDFVHSRGRNSGLWECNVTPVYGGCQEGNTIGCVSSNDGLDAGLVSFFPQLAIVLKLRNYVSGSGWSPEGKTTTGAKALGSCVGYAALKGRSSTVLLPVVTTSSERGPQGTLFVID
jgi:hypothetical protein